MIKMATVITFDTLKFAQSLIEAGFTEQQAKTLTQNQKEILDESVANLLATKGDIQDVRKDISHLENIVVEVKGEMVLIKYMLGVCIALLIALTMKFIFN